MLIQFDHQIIARVCRKKVVYLVRPFRLCRKHVLIMTWHVYYAIKTTNLSIKKLVNWSYVSGPDLAPLSSSIVVNR